MPKNKFYNYSFIASVAFIIFREWQQYTNLVFLSVFHDFRLDINAMGDNNGKGQFCRWHLTQPSCLNNLNLWIYICLLPVACQSENSSD